MKKSDILKFKPFDNEAMGKVINKRRALLQTAHRLQHLDINSRVSNIPFAGFSNAKALNSYKNKCLETMYKGQETLYELNRNNLEVNIVPVLDAGAFIETKDNGALFIAPVKGLYESFDIYKIDKLPEEFNWKDIALKFTGNHEHDFVFGLETENSPVIDDYTEWSKQLGMHVPTGSRQFQFKLAPHGHVEHFTKYVILEKMQQARMPPHISTELLKSATRKLSPKDESTLKFFLSINSGLIYNYGFPIVKSVGIPQFRFSSTNHDLEKNHSDFKTINEEVFSEYRTLVASRLRLNLEDFMFLITFMIDNHVDDLSEIRILTEKLLRGTNKKIKEAVTMLSISRENLPKDKDELRSIKALANIL